MATTIYFSGHDLSLTFANGLSMGAFRLDGAALVSRPNNVRLGLTAEAVARVEAAIAGYRPEVIERRTGSDIPAGYTSLREYAAAQPGVTDWQYTGLDRDGVSGWYQRVLDRGTGVATCEITSADVTSQGKAR